MKVSRLFNPLILGVSAFISSQNIRADDLSPKPQPAIPTKQIEFPERLDEYESWQSSKLDQIINLPDSKASEIDDGLNELRLFHRNKVHDSALFEELLKTATPKLEQVLKKCIEGLTSNDPELQKISADNLDALTNFFPTGIEYPNLNAIEQSAIFFNETLQKPIDDVRSYEAFKSAAFTLLEMLHDGEESIDPKSDKVIEAKSFALKFIQWIDRQTDATIADPDRDRAYQKQIVLEDAIGHFLEIGEIYFFQTTYLECVECLQSLLPTYTKIIKNNNSDLELLTNSIEFFIEFQSLYLFSNYFGNKKEFEDLSLLFDVILDGICKLPNQSQRGLIDDIFESVSLDTFKEYLDSITNSFSKHYFQQNEKSRERLSLFINSAIDGRYTNITITKLNIDLVLKLVEKNPDYFEYTMRELIDTIKKTNDVKEKIVALEELKELFVLCSRVSHLQYKPNDPPFGHHIELRLKLDNWSEKNIEPPIQTLFLNQLQDEHVRVKEENNERYINNKSWEELNKCFIEVAQLKPDFVNEVINTVKTRLANDKNPYDRELDYMSLACILPYCDDLKNENVNKVISLLKEGLIKESSPQAIRGIAYTCATILDMNNDLKRGYLTLKIRAFLENKRVNWEEFNTIELTPIQKTAFDCMRIVSGDREFTRALMPDRKFPEPTVKIVNGKEELIYSEELIEDGKALRQLEHNSFLFLAYLACQYHCYNPNYGTFVEYELKKATSDFLEKKLSFNIMELDPFSYEHWGEKVYAMSKLYRNELDLVKENPPHYTYRTKEESDTIINDLSNASQEFRGLFFENLEDDREIFGHGDPIFKIFEENYIAELGRELLWKELHKIKKEWHKKVDHELKAAKTKEEREAIEDRNPIFRLMDRTNPEHERLMREVRNTEEYKTELNKGLSYLNLIKLKIAQGMLNSAGHHELGDIRESLKSIGDYSTGDLINISQIIELLEDKK